MVMVRRIGAVILVLAASGIWFGMKPAPPATSYSSAISGALSDDAANQARAQGAPQQSVVNGWTARDLLAVIAAEGATTSSDERPVALLVVAVVGVALILITGESAKPAGELVASPAAGDEAGPAAAVSA